MLYAIYFMLWGIVHYIVDFAFRLWRCPTWANPIQRFSLRWSVEYSYAVSHNAHAQTQNIIYRYALPTLTDMVLASAEGTHVALFKGKSEYIPCIK